MYYSIEEFNDFGVIWNVLLFLIEMTRESNVISISGWKSPKVANDIK